MVEIPTIEPGRIVAGTTVKWRREDLADFPASSWTLTYEINGPAGGQISKPAVADGDAFAMTLTKDETAALPAGRYLWQAFVSDATERYSISRGEFEVETDLAAEAAGFDHRSETEKALEAVEAVLGKRASIDQQAYQIAGRRLDRTPIPDLLLLRDRLRTDVRAQRRARKIKNSLGGGGTVQVRFTS